MEVFKITAFLILIGPLLASAKTTDSGPKKSSRIPVRKDQVLEIKYSQRSWNKDPLKIDTARIAIYDKLSKRTILVGLQETEPDSAIFYGYYSVGWADQKFIDVKVYVPKNDRLNQLKPDTKINLSNFNTRPFVLLPGANGHKQLGVFNSKEQAIEAYNTYQKLKKAEEEAKKPKPKPVPDESLLEAQRLAAIEAKKRQLEEEARQRELERIRLKQLEEEKAKQARERAKRLKAAEKAKRKAKAKKIAEQAMAAYRKADYTGAENLFEKSIELDPENDTYYYQFGVTLYRNQKYNKSLVYLRLAKGEEVNQYERAYFMAMNHLRLKEYPDAQKQFDTAVKANDKVIAPSSAFYKGIIFFATQNLDAARDSFQVVLDTSEDPNLDRQAEGYIEQIARIKKFKELQRKPFNLMFLAAWMYDSNVLQVDNTAVSNTNTASGRTLGLLEFGYRPIFDPHNEFTIVLNGLNMTTIDEELVLTDPTSFGIKMPYKYRGKLFDSGWQLSVTPSYTSMSINDAAYSTNSAIAIDSTHIIGQSWAHTIKLNYGLDTPAEEASAFYLDFTGSRTGLKYVASNFLNSDKTRAMNYEIGVSSNQTNGANSAFSRIDLAVGYTKPAFWSTSFTSKLSVYNSTFDTFYTEDDDGNLETDTRSDFNAALSFSLNKPFKDWLTGTSNFTYTQNNSSNPDNTFDKYSIMIGVLMNPRF